MQMFYSIACVVSIVAMYLQVRAFIEQLRFRRKETSMHEDNETTSKLRKHTKRLVKTQRTMNLVCPALERSAYRIGVVN